MKCYICVKSASKKITAGDYELIECHSCGKYYISGSLVEVLKIKSDESLDTKVMQEWLIDQRKHGNDIPKIQDECILKYK